MNQSTHDRQEKFLVQIDKVLAVIDVWKLHAVQHFENFSHEQMDWHLRQGRSRFSSFSIGLFKPIWTNQKQKL